MGRSQPTIVMGVQAPVTHAAIVATMEPELGHPPRLVRTPDVCDRLQASEEGRLPGLVDRWASYGIAARVVQIPPTNGPSIRDRHPIPSSYQERTGRDPSTPTTGRIRKAGPRMGSTTDDVHEGRDQTVHPPTDAQFPDETMDAPREMEASCEEIER
jgi:hypothetical protein